MANRVDLEQTLCSAAYGLGLQMTHKGVFVFFRGHL